MDRPVICLTGGGTAGHVTPNLALAEAIYKSGMDCFYVGSRRGIENQLAESAKIRFYAIRCDKLRRFFTLRNLLFPFNNLVGFIGALWRLFQEKPAVVFSSGGYVGFPVLLAARTLGIPIIIYDGDTSQGLANRVASYFAHTICTAIPELAIALQQRYPKKSVLQTSHFIHSDFFRLKTETIRKDLHLCQDKKVILVFGGSLGSLFINDITVEILDRLLERYQVVHVWGSSQSIACKARSGYVPLQYIKQDFASYLDLADLVICRAGANTLAEISFLNKLNILIPLPSRASRGDQIENALRMQSKKISTVIRQEDCDAQKILDAIEQTFACSESIIQRMKTLQKQNATAAVMACIREHCQGSDSISTRHFSGQAKRLKERSLKF